MLVRAEGVYNGSGIAGWRELRAGLSSWRGDARQAVPPAASASGGSARRRAGTGGLQSCTHFKNNVRSAAMADSAARIAEIRQALTSTGKSVSAYSQKCGTARCLRRRCQREAPCLLGALAELCFVLRRFAAGEAPEQEQSQRLHGEVDATLLHDDAIQSFLDNLTTVAKVRRAGETVAAPRTRAAHSLRRTRYGSACRVVARADVSANPLACAPAHAQDLSGRSSGRNADDVHKITDGVRFLNLSVSCPHLQGLTCVLRS